MKLTPDVVWTSWQVNLLSSSLCAALKTSYNFDLESYLPFAIPIYSRLEHLSYWPAVYLISCHLVYWAIVPVVYQTFRQRIFSFMHSNQYVTGREVVYPNPRFHSTINLILHNMTLKAFIRTCFWLEEVPICELKGHSSKFRGLHLSQYSANAVLIQC